MSEDLLLHEYLSKLKELCADLGRVPNKDEFCVQMKGSHTKLKLMGGYTALLRAAGLPIYDGSNKPRITNGIFETSLEEHLEEYKPQEPLPPPEKSFIYGTYPKLSSISDIHWPFCNKKLIQAFIERVRVFQPEYCFINGDAWDFYSHSRYPRSHNLFTPKEEEETAQKMNAYFWKGVQENSPNTQCIQLLGNHDIRPMKRVLEQYPQAEDWIKERMEKLFTFPGVKTIFNYREEFILGNIAIFHGYRTQLGAHRDYTLYNTINGHTHLGGVSFRKIRNFVLWELNSGLAGDPFSKGLSWTPQKLTTWTPGWAEVDPFGPRFVPWC